MVTLNGLPAHPLLVHAVVVLMPLTALLVVLSVWRTSWRERIGVALPVLGTAVLVLTPLTTHAGEWLQARLPDNEVTRHHAQVGDLAKPVAVLLFLAAVVVWWLPRRAARRAAAGGPAASGMLGSGTLGLIVGVLAAVVSVGAVVLIVVIGDTGAQAVWHGIVNNPVQTHVSG